MPATTSPITLSAYAGVNCTSLITALRIPATYRYATVWDLLVLSII